MRGWEAGQPGLGVRGHAAGEDSRGGPPRTDRTTVRPDEREAQGSVLP